MKSTYTTEKCYFLIRSTDNQKGKKMYNRGEIRFSTPERWVEYAVKKPSKIGDKLEGSIVGCHKLDLFNFAKFYKKYSENKDIFVMEDNRFLYFKRRSSMKLPCFCLYGVKDSNIKKTGKFEMKHNIPSEYFKTFMEDKSKEEVQNLPEEKRPCVIVITNTKEFINRIYFALEKMGYDRNEIIVDGIKYYDFQKYGEYSWFDVNREQGKELLVKHPKFLEQSEIRIIINSLKHRINKELIEKGLVIGPINDIAQKVESYLYKGVAIEMKHVRRYVFKDNLSKRIYKKYK